MSIQQLADQLANAFGYWKSHPDYAVADWQGLVANGDTRQGYWQWVASNLEDGLANQQYEEDLKAERILAANPVFGEPDFAARLKAWEEAQQRGQTFVDDEQDREDPF